MGMSICIYTKSMHIHIYRYIYIYIHIICMMHAYIHSFIHTYLHTYIPTYIYAYRSIFITYIRAHILYARTCLHTHVPTTDLRTCMPSYVPVYLPAEWLGLAGVPRASLRTTFGLSFGHPERTALGERTSASRCWPPPLSVLQPCARRRPQGHRHMRPSQAFCHRRSHGGE